MPKTDIGTAADVRATAAPPGSGDHVQPSEEGLATALSSFLSQLHGMDDQQWVGVPANAEPPSETAQAAPSAGELALEPPPPPGVVALPRLAKRPAPSGLGVNPGLGRVIPPTNETTKAVVASHRPPPMKILPPVHRPSPTVGQAAPTLARQPTPSATPVAKQAPVARQAPGASTGPANTDIVPAARVKPLKPGPSKLSLAKDANGKAGAGKEGPPPQFETGTVLPSKAPSAAGNALRQAASASAQVLSRAGARVGARAGAGNAKRKLARGGIVLLVAAAVAGGLAWGFSASSRANQAHMQLVATQNSLGVLDQDLSAQAHRYSAMQHTLAAAMKQSASNKAQLTASDHELVKAQQQLANAQGQVLQAQSQLNNTQQNLSATQTRASQCQTGTTLGQESVQLLTEVNLSQISYLNAAQAKNVKLMKIDISHMRQLLQQQQALGPKFTAAVALCAK